jgi:4-alpha-glucanotransferase
MKRGSGVLLPVASLWGDYGIGGFGKPAYGFVDALAACKQKYWQILPLSPTSYGDSPYQSCSAFAVNPYFIDPGILAQEGLLTDGELQSAKRDATARIDYGDLFVNRVTLLKTAFSRFKLSPAFKKFAAAPQIREYALYMALKERRNYRPWHEWESGLKFLTADRRAAAEREYAADIAFWAFTQYKAQNQWRALKAYAAAKGVAVIGDIPIYVAGDSADVWLHKELFKTLKSGELSAVAGVPPDYFSADGQLWGNPVYNWRRMKASGYEWFLRRIDFCFSLYDYVRIDHFRGFDRFYQIKRGQTSAKNGVWLKGPSWNLFRRLKGRDIIAEDLGTLDDGVKKLIARTGYPGMKVLCFAFDGNPQNPYKPSAYAKNCIAYTGTHDNEPFTEFAARALAENAEGFLDEFNAELTKAELPPLAPGADRYAVTKSAIELLMKSDADAVIFPLADLLMLGADSRINTPSTLSDGNWSFRVRESQIGGFTEFLHSLTEKYNR